LLWNGQNHFIAILLIPLIFAYVLSSAPDFGISTYSTFGKHPEMNNLTMVIYYVFMLQ